MTHTPAPWHFDKGNDSHAGFSMKFLVGADGQGFAHTVGLDEPTDTANAHLIAAAPELLEALELYMEVGDQCSKGYISKCFRQAQAAIAKAKGN